MMEAICYPETPVNFQGDTRLYIPEGEHFFNHCCDILKTYMVLLLFSGKAEHNVRAVLDHWISNLAFNVKSNCK
jgi:hypothetical protein